MASSLVRKNQLKINNRRRSAVVYQQFLPISFAGAQGHGSVLSTTRKQLKAARDAKVGARVHILREGRPVGAAGAAPPIAKSLLDCDIVVTRA